MKKTNRKMRNILCAAAVLLAACTILFAAMALSATASTPTHTLTVVLEGENVTRVESCYVVYYPNGNSEEAIAN